MSKYTNRDHVFFFYFLLLPVLLLTSGSADLIAQQTTIERQVLSGGATQSTDPTHTLQATVGQTTVGVVVNQNKQLSQGFWFTKQSAERATSQTNDLELTPISLPWNQAGELIVTAKNTGILSLKIFSIDGREINTLYSGEITNNAQLHVSVDASLLSSGDYLIKAVQTIQTQSIEATLPVVIVK